MFFEPGIYRFEILLILDFFYPTILNYFPEFRNDIDKVVHNGNFAPIPVSIRERRSARSRSQQDDMGTIYFRILDKPVSATIRHLHYWFPSNISWRKRGSRVSAVQGSSGRFWPFRVWSPFT